MKETKIPIVVIIALIVALLIAIKTFFPAGMKGSDPAPPPPPDDSTMSVRR